MNWTAILNHIYDAAKTNSTEFDATTAVIKIGNAIDRIEGKIRTVVATYNTSRPSSSDLSGGSGTPFFCSTFHELVPLWVEYELMSDNDRRARAEKLRLITMVEDRMVLWYGMRNYKQATVTIAAPGVWTLDNHGFRTNDRVILETTGALPTGLSAETWYYVIYVTEHTFKLSSTRDGSAITTSGSQSGNHYVGRERQQRVRTRGTRNN